MVRVAEVQTSIRIYDATIQGGNNAIPKLVFSLRLSRTELAVRPSWRAISLSGAAPKRPVSSGVQRGRTEGSRKPRATRRVRTAANLCPVRCATSASAIWPSKASSSGNHGRFLGLKQGRPILHRIALTAPAECPVRRATSASGIVPIIFSLFRSRVSKPDCRAGDREFVLRR